MLTGPRLRQVALVDRDGEEVSRRLAGAFGWESPLRDPGVAVLDLAAARQQLRLVPSADGAGGGITEMAVAGLPCATARVGGVRFVREGGRS